MTFIEQTAKHLVSYGSRFYTQSVKSEDCITVWFDEAVFPQTITACTTYTPGNAVIIRVWGQTSENEWILLWEAPPERGMVTSGKCCPPIRQLQILMCIFRIDLSHSLLQYHATFDSVVLTGYQPNQGNSDGNRRLGKFQFFRWRLSEWWLARRFRSHNYKHKLPELNMLKINNGQHNCNKDNIKLLPTLPDEIILEIFSYLDVKSLCRCAQVNKRWLAISQDASLYYELNLTRYWHKMNNAVLQHFMEINKNLQRLDLSWCGRDELITEELFIKFLQTCCRNLTHLSLGYCQFVGNLTIYEIGKCSNFTDLRLRDCGSWYYLPLAQLNRLTILDLDFTFITDESLIAILSANPNLEHLILDYCPNLKRLDDIAQIVAVYNSKLITWSSWSCCKDSLSSVGIGHLAKCAELRELDIGWCLYYNSFGDSLERISRGCKNLQSLALQGCLRNAHLTEDCLLPIISCDKLTRLDIGFNARISKDFCEMILASLPNLKLLNLDFGAFEEERDGQVKEEQIAEWSIQYPNVVIQLYGSSAIPMCVRPNSENI